MQNHTIDIVNTCDNLVHEQEAIDRREEEYQQQHTQPNLLVHHHHHHHHDGEGEHHHHHHHHHHDHHKSQHACGDSERLFSSASTFHAADKDSAARKDCHDDGGAADGAPLPTEEEDANAASDAAKAFVVMPIRFRILLMVSSAAMAIAGSAISFYAVNGINMEPVELNNYWMYTSWCALLNPFIGFLSDTVEIRGENRRPLVVVGTFLVTLMFFLFASIPITTQNYSLFVFLSLIQSWGEALITAPMNGMLIEMFIHDDEAVDATTAIASASSYSSSCSSSSAAEGDVAVVGDVDASATAINSSDADVTNDAAAPTATSATSSFATNSASPVIADVVNADEERQKRLRSLRRIAIMSRIQAQAMQYRSLGSLFGSIFYTVAVIWVNLTQMLWVSGGVYALVVPAVMILDAEWCQAPKKHKEAKEAEAKARKAEEKERKRAAAAAGTAGPVGEGEEEENAAVAAVGGDNAPLIPSSDDDDDNSIYSTSLTRRCMHCSRRFTGLYDRITLGWDWRNPSQGTIGVLCVLIFVVLYTGTLDASSVYFSYISTQFEFSNWFNSFNSSLGMLGGVIGAFVYEHFVDWLNKRKAAKAKQREEAENAAAAAASDTVGVPVVDGDATAGTTHVQAPKKRKSSRRATTAFGLFVFGSVCGALGYVTNMMLATNFVPGYVPIPPYIFVPLDNFLTSLFSRFAFMPVLSVAAERCPEGYEASVFEMFSVACLVGGTMSSSLSGFLATDLGITSNDYSATWLMLLICAIGKGLPVIVAWLMPVHEKSATAMLANAILESQNTNNNTNNSEEENAAAAAKEVDTSPAVNGDVAVSQH